MKVTLYAKSVLSRSGGRDSYYPVPGLPPSGPVFGRGGSIQLARIFGVRIGVDASWFFVLFLIIWQLSGYYGDLFPGQDTKAFALAVLSALLFFVSITLHELGHAVVAMRNGIGIAGIDLWLFGGVAKMERDAQTPGEDFRVAVAGPVVTLLIVAVCFGAGTLTSSAHDAWELSRFETGAFGATTAVLSYLAFINAILLVFNLVPGFPLDGGRIARSIAWWRTGDRIRATRFAARLGRFFSFVMMAFGGVLLLSGKFIGVWFLFIGLFLGQAARSQELQTVLTSKIEGLRVADVMDAEPVAIPEQLTLDRALDEYFLRYGWPWFPVVDPNGHLTGLVSREAVESVPEQVRPTRPVASAMARDDPGSAFRVGLEEPLESLLGLEALQRLGAIMAVDREGILRGIVTVDQVRRVLRPTAPAAS
jgi:Zn-dependent protease